MTSSSDNLVHSSRPNLKRRISNTLRFTALPKHLFIDDAICCFKVVRYQQLTFWDLEGERSEEGDGGEEGGEVGQSMRCGRCGRVGRREEERERAEE